MAAAAYRACACLRDELQRRDAPLNAAKKTVKRKDSRTAREWEVALDTEFPARRRGRSGDELNPA